MFSLKICSRTLEKDRPDVLMQRNPDLVVVRVSGWGQTGPYADKPGFGSLIEGMSGFAAMAGFADREPLLPPLALADMIAGLAGYVGCCRASCPRSRSGGSRLWIYLLNHCSASSDPWRPSRHRRVCSKAFWQLGRGTHRATSNRDDGTRVGDNAVDVGEARSRY